MSAGGLAGTEGQPRALLWCEGVRLSFGGVSALDGVGLHVYPGEILALIGPNGAGKTSLLNCLSGFYRPQEGRIFFQGTEITHLPTHRIAAMGIGRTFQGVQLFQSMTVLDNVLAGRHLHMRTGLWQDFFWWPFSEREERRHRAVAEEIIDFLELEPYRKRVVGELGYGLRKRVDLGRALAMEPKVLLMDEPMAGMNLEEKEDMARFILDVREARRIPIVLVEHDMEVIMDISDRVVVLDWGHVIAEGPPDQIRSHPDVIRAYLGEA